MDCGPIIVGDLHACIEHLGNILDHDNNRRDLDEGRAYLLFVGDILHDDRVGYMRETANSIQILNQVLTLVATWPGRVFYIRGNHDTFDERLRKSGVAQEPSSRRPCFRSPARPLLTRLPAGSRRCHILPSAMASSSFTRVPYGVAARGRKS